MQAVYDRWPNVVVQFEDFETPKGGAILTAYRDKYRCFNDDIQGTGSVTLAGILFVRAQRGTSITEMSFLCAGAGSAELGVCQQIVDGMVEAGLPREEAMARFVVCSSVGAIGKPDGTPRREPQARPLLDRAPWVHPTIADGTSMVDVVKTSRAPTCLLTKPRKAGFIFSEELVRAMSYTAHRDADVEPDGEGRVHAAARRTSGPMAAPSSRRAAHVLSGRDRGGTPSRRGVQQHVRVPRHRPRRVRRRCGSGRLGHMTAAT